MKASEFRHCPMHCIQCITYALKPFFARWHTRKWAELMRILVNLTVPIRIWCEKSNVITVHFGPFEGYGVTCWIIRELKMRTFSPWRRRDSPGGLGRGCRSRAKINLLKILMTASLTSSSTSAVLSEIQSLLFVAWPHLKIFDNFSFFTTTVIWSTMKISFSFTTCFRWEIQVFLTTGTLALTWTTWVRQSVRPN